MRSLCETYRILRDTKLARQIKQLHNNRCQICGKTIDLSTGEFYSEVHHIKPLGAPHNGSDVAGNIIVLCPNHHVMCDYGAIPLKLEEIKQHPNHEIIMEYVTYHNDFLLRNRSIHPNP
jgi:predicted restriction endonuclease